ncbi:MAG: chloride channel protein [Candidatus Acidiferrales bacterium]
MNTPNHNDALEGPPQREPTAGSHQPPQPATYRLALVSALAAGIGALVGFIAYALYSLIGLFTNIAFYHEWSFHFRSPRNSPLGWWMILIPVVGGLLIGLMAKYGSEKIRGHGIPEAMEAVLTSRSRIEAKVAFLKPLSAAIGIGTGGPFGAEGPIIQTGGAFGSLVGQFISTTAAERKVMLACGGGAGLAATFNAPITGVLLALELLLFEFRTRSFIPVVIASTMAVAVRRLLFGGGPMFAIGTVDYNFLPGLPYYIALGLLCGFAAVAFTRALEKLEEFFDHLKIVPSFLHPALGAVGLGIVGFLFPRVLGSGYDTIEDVLNNHLVLSMVLLVLLLKTFVVLLSLGSGTSGGTLAPIFMISAAIGSSFAIIVDRVMPSAHLSPEAFAVAAMGALLGASSRATFTFMFCAFETTRDFHAVLPVLLVCVLADGVAFTLLPNSIMTQKFAKRGMPVPGESETEVLKAVRVSELMRTDVKPIPQEMTVAELAERMSRGERAYNLTQGLPVVSSDGKLVGVVTQGDLLRTLEQEPKGSMTVLEAGTQPAVVAYPDELAHDAMYRMLQRDIGRLPVVSRDHPEQMVGYFNRSSVLGAWTRQMQEESIREHGWVRQWRSLSRAMKRTPQASEK